MVKMPEAVVNTLNDPNAFKVIATADEKGDVHAIQVGAAVAPSPELIAVGAILMKRTSKNLEGMMDRDQKAVVIMGKQMESYQVKAMVKGFETSGPVFDAMSAKVKELGLTLRGVWMLEPVEVWNQSANYEAGKRMD